MIKMKLPLRYVPFSNGIHKNIGSLKDANNKAIAIFVNIENAEIILVACNSYQEEDDDKTRKI